MKFRGIGPQFLPAMARMSMLTRKLNNQSSSQLTVESLRARAGSMGSWLTEQFGIVPNISITDHDADGVRLRAYRPLNLRVTDAPSPAIFHIHGGGMIMSSVESYDQRCAAYAHATGFPVYSVDYRLAPEHPFPAQIEDSFAAYTWLQRQSQILGIDPHRVALLGNSAGSGLAVGLAVKIIDESMTPPSCQVLIYPMLDDRNVTTKRGWEHVWFYWSFADNKVAWDAYLSGLPYGEQIPSYAAPARASDEVLALLPDTYICVGTADIFLDEDVEFAQRLTSLGVKVELDLIDGAPHNFDYLVPHARASRQSWRTRFQYLVKHI